ncbi:MAG: hypothetical protein U0840_05505 [Gemmataceae bacterium]
MLFDKSYLRVIALGLVALGVTLLGPAAARAQSWGTVKGTVVFDGEAPAAEKANVDKDQAHCLENGPILTNDLVVNKKNKGVRWVLVWLTDPKDARNAKFVPPIHPSLKEFKKTIEIDQPCCVFEPRIIGVRVGQTLVVKNSAPIPHNFKIDSIGGGPVQNPLIPAKGKAEVEGFVPKLLPTMYTCSIHAWMKGWIGTFPHPYFAITNEDGEFEIKNAPAGKFRLMVWQEKAGWVIIDSKNPTNRGKIIEIKADGVTDVGKIPLSIKD